MAEFSSFSIIGDAAFGVCRKIADRFSHLFAANQIDHEPHFARGNAKYLAIAFACMNVPPLNLSSHRMHRYLLPVFLSSSACPLKVRVMARTHPACGRPYLPSRTPEHACVRHIHRTYDRRTAEKSWNGGPVLMTAFLFAFSSSSTFFIK